MDFGTFQAFLERFGVAVAVAAWFMFRQDKQMTRLTSKTNRLIIAVMSIAKTLDLDEESERLLDAASDEDEGSKDGAP